jgi:spore germination protein KC
MKKLFLILILFSLSGCWNYRELNQLAIATGFAIDYIDDEFQVTILISNSQKQNSSSDNSKASTAIYKGMGKTIFEAIKDAAMSISKQVYLSHIEVLVLSSEVASSKTMEVIDFFFRYPQTRNEFLMVIAEDCMASDVFLVTTPLETYPSLNIAKNLSITDKLQGYTYAVTFNEFVKTLLEEGVNPVLPSINIIGDVEEGNKEDNIKQNEPSTYLKLGMMGIFKGSNFKGFSNHDQSKGINLINSKVETTLIVTDCNDGYVVVELNNSEASIDINLDSQIPKIKINIESSGSIEEVACEIKLDEEQTIKDIKKNSEEEIKRLVSAGILFAQENETDIFGFGNMIYKKDYKYWNNIKDNWESDLFLKIDIETQANVNLKTKGSLDNIIEVK